MKIKKGMLAVAVALGITLLTGCGGGGANNAGNAGNKGNSGNAGGSAGGEGAAIAVISREDGSGTRGAFTEITGILEKDDQGNETDKTTPEAIVQNSTNGVMTTVAGNPDAIGYISLGSLNDTVKALKVNGVEPTAEDIINGSYPIARPFLLVTKEKNKLVEDFLAFCDSKDANAIVEDHGYVITGSGGEYKPSGLKGSFTTAGSTSVTPLMEKLVEAYTALNPDVKIDIQSNGSSAGIQGALQGSCQLGMSSRELKDSETGLETTVLAKDGIAVVVNNENPLEDISLENVKGVFTGEVKTWNDLK